MLLKQLAAFTVSLFLDIMIFDRPQQLKTWIKVLERRLERGILLRMFGDRHIEDGDGDGAFLAGDESPHQIGCYGTAGKGIDGDYAESAAVRSVRRNTDHGDSSSGCPADPRAQRLRPTRKCDDPIDFIPYRRLKRFFFAFAQARPRSKFHC